MPYAIELYFDPDAERAIREFRQSLIGLGIPATLDQPGGRPHISLALVAELNADQMSAALRDFSQTVDSFPITLAGINSFPGNEGVIFLAPAVTQPLLTTHARFHQLLAGEHLTSNGYYVPAQWTPHCTVAYGVAPNLIPPIVERARKAFQPIRGILCEIGLIFYLPVRPICSFALRP
jgi:2'-5' RNA ligase